MMALLFFSNVAMWVPIVTYENGWAEFAGRGRLERTDYHACLRALDKIDLNAKTGVVRAECARVETKEEK